MGNNDIFWNKMKKYNMGEEGVYDLSDATPSELMDILAEDENNLTDEDRSFLNTLYDKLKQLEGKEVIDNNGKIYKMIAEN